MKIALAALGAILAWGSPARAQIYTDYSAWAAAVEDIQPAAASSFPATEQTYISTALGGCAFSIAGGPTIETTTAFFVMSFPGDCSEGAGHTDTAVLEADVQFPFDTFFGVVVSGPDVVVNGFNVGYSTFGVIGMSNLDFTVTESGTDNGDGVSFGYGLVVASPRPVPEPAAIALLGIGLFGIGVERRRA